jgi:hypothetical protein
MSAGKPQNPSNRIGHVAAALMEGKQKHKVTELARILQLIVNTKENGYVHRLSTASQLLSRDQRRAHCGWRAGSSAAKARFCETRVWPPTGSQTTRICGKCFPNCRRHVYVASQTLVDGDTIEMT